MTLPGYGTATNPLRPEDSNYPLIQSGHTVIFTTGTHNGTFTFSTDGVLVTCAAGAILEGDLVIEGDDITVDGLYISNTTWPARYRDNVIDPIEEVMVGLVDHEIVITGANVEMRNCFITDMHNGVYSRFSASGLYLHDNIIINTGHVNSTYIGGHGTYLQNEDADHPIILERNIISGGCSVGVKIYTTQDRGIVGVILRNNISYNNDYGWNYYVGSWYEFISDILVDHNYSYQPAGNFLYNNFGYLSGTPEDGGVNHDITVTDNYFPEGYSIYNPDVTTTIDTGNVGTRPASGLYTAISPATEQNTALLAVYNWDLDNSVDVDLSAIPWLEVGDTVALRQASDFLNDIVAYVIPADKTITIDMQNASRGLQQRYAGDPNEGTAYNPKGTVVLPCFPEFGAFVVSAPLITENDSISISMKASDGSISYTLHAIEPHVSTFTWSISTAASHGTAAATGTGSSNAVTYTPLSTFSGVDSFVVKVTDENDATDFITVNVTVFGTLHHTKISGSTRSMQFSRN